MFSPIFSPRFTFFCKSGIITQKARTETVMISLQKIGFVGLGVIGGSFAKAIRQYFPDCQIVAFDKNKETLAYAIQEDIIHISCSAIDKNFSGCDFVFLCAPISYNNAYLSRLKDFLTPGCILTDVGSVKTSIHEEVQRLGLDRFFIGGHPMAGSEKSGFVNSNAHLMENAYYVLTPSSATTEDQLQKYQEFVTTVKAIPLVLDYHLHDRVTGAISHLPHIIAASLVNYIRETDTPDELMKNLAAGGFKDITRIASSSPVMWQQICLKNQENISEILEEFIQMLQRAKAYVDGREDRELYHMFETSRDYRDSMPTSSSGPLKKTYAVYCDIVDEAGGIATIATILASNAISLKNIGIIHNREFEEGVLCIEFYDNVSYEKAVSVLKRHHYTIYER